MALVALRVVLDVAPRGPEDGFVRVHEPLGVGAVVRVAAAVPAGVGDGPRVAGSARVCVRAADLVRIARTGHMFFQGCRIYYHCATFKIYSSSSSGTSLVALWFMQ